jgi:hypothetical protein
MLTDYRTSLEALRSRPSNDLDALMKLTRELADVQSQIETLTAARRASRSEWKPNCSTCRSTRIRALVLGSIRSSLTAFGDVLSSAIGAAIIAIAYLLPWAVLVGGITWIAQSILAQAKARARRHMIAPLVNASVFADRGVSRCGSHTASRRRP